MPSSMLTALFPVVKKVETAPYVHIKGRWVSKIRYIHAVGYYLTLKRNVFHFLLFIFFLFSVFAVLGFKPKASQGLGKPSICRPRKEILTHATTRFNIEFFILNESSQTQMDKDCDSTCRGSPVVIKFLETENRIVVTHRRLWE